MTLFKAMSFISKEAGRDNVDLLQLKGHRLAEKIIREGIAWNKGKADDAAVESLAYQLHNRYCAFEDLFRIIAVFFENQIEDKSLYHTELLKRMALTIEGVRPALLSGDSFVLLDNLRSFRHFFRHAYSYDLDERKVQIVLDDVTKLRELYARDVEGFIKSWTS